MVRVTPKRSTAAPSLRSIVRFFLIAVLLCASVGADLVQAHRALLLNEGATDRAGALRLEDADIAWAIFGALPPGGTQFVSFARPGSGMFRARVLVPARGATLSLNPWIALVGPGLPRPDGFDALLGPGEGAVLVAGPADRELDLFQAVPYPVLIGASLEMPLPADGPFFLLIFDPTGEGGSYLIDTGYLQD